jgi:hypothetical protein
MAFPLRPSFSSGWFLFMIGWAAFLFVFLAYVAYEHVLYPSESVSEAELFQQVKAIQTKARVVDLSRERDRRRGSKAGQLVPKSAPAHSSESLFLLAPVPDRRRYPRLEISEGTTAGVALEDFER